ncbi:MAG TPA: (Fe-S)-binding protein, partial [Kiloniellaceae bacterium]|nr:(Fe-S)-binding protein [Kiloniellaceae bacterium]
AALAMTFLNLTDPRAVRTMRLALARWGFLAVNLAHAAFQRLGLLGESGRPPSASGDTPALRSQVVELVRRPLRVEVPKQTTRALLGLEEAGTVPILRDPARAGEESEAVFYFPGCGSERLFSDVALAALAMLYDTGVQTVLPPGYLCCGYPQQAAGLEEKAHAISTANRVLFHRVANTLNYLDIRTVLVSCGTCIDQLLKYEFERIFPGCRLLDIHEYLMEKGVSLEGAGRRYLFHDPCHSPMKIHDPVTVTATLLGDEVRLSDRCCGEAGTLGTARPDIAEQIRFRKAEELKRGLTGLTGRDRVESGEVKILTTCPACQQGLSRYRDETGLATDYVVVELARRRLGDGWRDAFVQRVTRGGIERVLL